VVVANHTSVGKAWVPSYNRRGLGGTIYVVDGAGKQIDHAAQRVGQSKDRQRVKLLRSIVPRSVSYVV